MKRPDLTLGMSLGRAAAELAIIVAGVLIALGAQSWWETRQVREDRELAYRALSSDVEAALTTLRQDENLDGTRIALEWLLDGEADTDAVSDSVYWGRITAALWAYPATSPGLPVLDALSGTEALELFPLGLRRLLSSFESTRFEFSDARRDIYQLQYTQLDPVLIEETPFAEILAVGREEARLAPTYPSERLPESFLGAPVMRNRLAAKLSTASYLGTFRDRMVAQLDSIAGVIAEATGG